MKNSKKKGILEKKGMHGVIRPWARREIEYDPSARVLRYSSGGKVKGTVMLKPKESQIKIINPKDANGKAFAFEVSCFKLSETGAAERTQQRSLHGHSNAFVEVTHFRSTQVATVCNQRCRAPIVDEYFARILG